MNTSKSNEKDKTYNQDSVVAKKLLSKKEIEVVSIQIIPGKSLPAHKTSVDVFFFIIEGTGEVEIDGKCIPVSSGSLIESPPNILHGLHNTADNLLKVLVIKTPRP